MEVATHGPLSRTYTAPPSSVPSRLTGSGSTLMHSNGHISHSSSEFSSYSAPSARASHSTQGTFASSQSSLHAQPPLPTSTPVNGGPVEATNNVLNKRAEKETSLFQICLNLRQRLRGVPGFEQLLVEEEQDADEDTDPVTLLWRTFRRGYPLMSIYNSLNPAVPLSVDEKKIPERGRGKTATYKFLQACLGDLKFPASECFILADLYNDDTTGFVKVANVVNRVLDILVAEGVLQEIAGKEEDSESNGTVTMKRTQREHIIDELVRTERTYVQHLELLQAFKKLVEERGIVTGDAVHDIFLNLNALLDFQRRFLIRVEQTNAQPKSEQNWGKLFVLYKDAFKVYEPYIANQKKCEEVAMREFEKLKQTGGSLEMQQMVESPTNLTSFLLKPFQRLSKYPLLLRELRDKGDLDDERKEDVSTGIEAASSVLQRTNAAVDLEERMEAVRELEGRVEDWKGHNIAGFGELLLHGTFSVLKGENPTSKDSEREYKIYLFESILLCCKEFNINKQKNRITGRTLVTPSGKPKLQLKGRIFMQNVTETISIGKPGSYTCQIFWKGDPGIENFVIRFPSEETMKKWAGSVDQQRRLWQAHSRTSSRTNQSGHSGGPSATEFAWMRDQQPPMDNPYRQEEDPDDDDDVTLVSGSSYTGQSEAISRNGSSTSLRQRERSATGDSGPPMGSSNDTRAPPPRFPMGFSAQPLTLRTQQLQQQAAHSPNGGGPQDSYFSPSIESPMSSRTSSSSAGMFPFPWQQAPPNGWHGEEQNRFTAPAMAKQGSREGQNGSSTYPMYGRTAMQRPSLPPNAGSSHVSSSQARLRSASSPDIQNPLGSGRRMLNGTHQHPPVPDMPPFPTHYAYTPGIVNRSASNSPNNPAVHVPTRAATQSPAVQQGRLVQSRAGPEPNQYDYAAGPARVDSRHVPMARTMTPGGLDQARTMTPASVDSRTMSPPLPSMTPRPDDIPIPSQLKVKVHCPSAGSTMTLVVSTNISYQSLKDRIDAKLQRSTNVSLSSGQVKLKYLDDDDYVNISSDEDVQTAFESWKEQQRDQIIAGQLGEIELYCQR